MNNIIKKIYSNIDYETSILIDKVNLGLILSTFGSGTFAMQVSYNTATSLFLISILNMIYYLYSNTNNLSSYTKDITKLKELYKLLIVDYNKLNRLFNLQNPVELYTLYNKMLRNGYLSKNKSFYFGDSEVRDINGISPINVINGEAVCRHIAVMLKDIYSDYGIKSYDISVFQKDVNVSLGIEKYNQRQLQNISDIKGIPVADLIYILEDIIQEAYTYYISEEDKKKRTNHRITKVTYNGYDYYLDPTQSRIYKPSKTNNLILLSQDGIRDTKIIPKANKKEALRQSPVTPFSEDLKYIKDTEHIYEQNKDIFEKFYRDHQELYSDISSELSKIKVKRKVKR